MSITTPREISARESAQAAPRAGGLRILGTRTLYLFAEFRYGPFSKTHITVGRTRKRDIRIRDHSISRHHCTITRTHDGGYVVADRGSCNGVHICEPAPGSRFRRVYHALLVIGMRVRLGAATLVVTDASGKCPITAMRGSEFCRQAVAIYGSRRAAAQITGLKRRLLGRLVPVETEGAR